METLAMRGPGSEPALIGLDWGTSSLRGYLIGRDGALLDRRGQPWGVQHLPAGGFAAAFRGITDGWLEEWPNLPILASGMVGSRHGWREVPYVDCPADPTTVAAGLVPFDGGCGIIHLVPGLSLSHPTPDVMRGEETQILGGLAIDPALGRESLFLLPGTHCKWATVGNGRVLRFTTYLTGELFALLRDHSILGRPAAEDAARDGSTTGHGSLAAFRHGVAMARESGASGIPGRLFSTRSLFLAGTLTAAQTLDYLSGLLVGDEIRSGLTGLPAGGPPPIVLVGDRPLCDRYREALGGFGIADVRTLDETGPAGLWRIAVAAGIVGVPDERSRAADQS